MTLTQTEFRGVIVMSCAGKLSLGSGDDELTAAVRAALDAGARRIVLNLSRLDWMDSAGVGAIVECVTTMAKRGAILRVVAAPDGAVHRIITVTQLDRAFDLFDDVESSLEGFGV